MNHSILLEKLESFGFSGNLVNLMYSYLSGRRQCVLVNGFRSRAYGQSSGVPQGSILGPLLFNLYVNDITVGIHSHCLLNADNFKIYRQIRSSIDCEQLQADLTTLCNWCNRHLPLNFKKCCVMSYARKLKPLTFDYFLDQGVLQRPDHVRDLGVTFEAHLTFDEHTHNVLSAAYRSLGFVIRNAKGIQEVDALKALYLALVRSRLEYASLVWYPIYGVTVSRLEGIQRRFLKYLSYVFNGVYPCRGCPHGELLQSFDIQSLSLRRKINSALFLYHLVCGRVDCPDLLGKLSLRVPRPNLRSASTFVVPTPRTNLLRRSPLFHAVSNFLQIEQEADIFVCRASDIRKAYGAVEVSEC
jgi:hypothetical protein